MSVIALPFILPVLVYGQGRSKRMAAWMLLNDGGSYKVILNEIRLKVLLRTSEIITEA